MTEGASGWFPLWGGLAGAATYAFFLFHDWAKPRTFKWWRKRSHIPDFTGETETKASSKQGERVESPASRVPTTIDPEQSQISYYGAAGLRVEVYIAIENGLDIEARLSKLELEAETAKESLSCRFVAFQPDPFADYIQQIGGIVLPARKGIKGWVHFQRKEGLRTDDFKRFVLMVRAIGEPEEEHAFEPHDWGDARLGQSTIVMLPPPVSDRIEIDKRILGIIGDLEQGGRPFNNRNVWGYLTDDRASYIDERLIHLKETGYITATIGPKRFIGATVSSPIREIEVHGLTDKGRLLLRRTPKQS